MIVASLQTRLGHGPLKTMCGICQYEWFLHEFKSQAGQVCPVCETVLDLCMGKDEDLEYFNRLLDADMLIDVIMEYPHRGEDAIIEWWNSWLQRRNP